MNEFETKPEIQHARPTTFQVEQMAKSHNCTDGGPHTPGTSGEWIGKCTKCGAPC